MIQRIQTLFLIAGSLAIGSIYLLGDIWRGPAAVESSWFTAATLGIFGICAVGALLAVFLFADRKRQRVVVMLLQLLAILGLVVLIAGEYLGGTLPFVGPESVGSQEEIGLGLVVLGYALFYLARRGIEKDIKLLRSRDRLR